MGVLDKWTPFHFLFGAAMAFIFFNISLWAGFLFVEPFEMIWHLLRFKRPMKWSSHTMYAMTFAWLGFGIMVLILDVQALPFMMTEYQ
jgi:hypothetical protein